MTIEKERGYQIQRNFKDTMFRMLFSEKERLLSLYNAISGSTYTDPELLDIVTLDNAIYIKYKNDLAFIIDSSIHLYEHQSTYSPNLPLRNLFYIGYEYEQLIAQHSVYSTKPIALPTPHFVVFYNGSNVDWESRTLKLSDLFQQKEEFPDLELVVHVYNINLGKNIELMKQCEALHHYAQYVDTVRGYARNVPIQDAVSMAVDECIRNGILSEFLIKNKAEAIHMSIFDYDEEHTMRMIRKDERDMGREEGRAAGLEEGRAQGHTAGLEEGRAQGHSAGLKEGRAQGHKEGLRLAVSALIKDYRDADFPDDWIAERLRKHFCFSEAEISEFLHTSVLSK